MKLSIKKLSLIPVAVVLMLSTIGVYTGSAKALTIVKDPNFKGFTSPVNYSPNTLSTGQIAISGAADENAQIEFGLYDNNNNPVTPTHLMREGWWGVSEYEGQVEISQNITPGSYLLKGHAVGGCDYSVYRTTHNYSDIKCDEDWVVVGVNIIPGIWANQVYTTDTTPNVTGKVNTPNANVQILIHSRVYSGKAVGNDWSINISDALSAGSHDYTAITNGASAQSKIVVTDSTVNNAPTKNTVGQCDYVQGHTCTITLSFSGTGAKAGDILRIVPWNVTINQGLLSHTLTPNEIANGYTISYTYNITRPSESCRKRCRLGVSISIVDAQNGTPVSGITGVFLSVNSGGGSTTIPTGSSSGSSNTTSSGSNDYTQVAGASTSAEEQSDKKPAGTGINILDKALNNLSKTASAKIIKSSNSVKFLWYALAFIAIFLVGWFSSRMYAQRKLN
jgi:hypothetical protein